MQKTGVDRRSPLFSELLFLKQSRNTSQNGSTCYSSFGLPLCHHPCLEEGQQATQWVFSCAQGRRGKHHHSVWHPLWETHSLPSLSSPTMKPLVSVLFPYTLSYPRTLQAWYKNTIVPIWFNNTIPFVFTFKTIHNSSQQPDSSSRYGWGGRLPESLSPIAGLTIRRISGSWAVKKCFSKAKGLQQMLEQ